MDGEDILSERFDDDDADESWWGRTKRWIYEEANFYRLHLTFFTITPLIFSGIFFAANGRYKISYIDSLFNCVSAMTVTGLATIDLSSLTPLQQVILFVQACMGNPVAVSWLVVYIRRSLFESKLEHFIERKIGKGPSASQNPSKLLVVPSVPWHVRLALVFQRLLRRQRDGESSPGGSDGSSPKQKQIRTDMITRSSDKPKLINPMGWISERANDDKARNEERGMPDIVLESSTPPNNQSLVFSDGDLPPIVESPKPLSLHENSEGILGQRTSNEEVRSPHSEPAISFSPDTPLPRPPERLGGWGHASRVDQLRRGADTDRMPRTATVDFVLNPVPKNRLGDLESSNPRFRARRHYSIDGAGGISDGQEVPTTTENEFRKRRGSVNTTGGERMVRSMSNSTPLSPTVHTRERGFGGFPSPHNLLARGFRAAFPHLERKLTRTLTVPSSAPERMTYISFEPVVGRNSEFHMLTTEELEELGGVEYRALNALLWLVGIYHVGLQAIAFVIIAPYISASRWRDAFNPPALHRPVNPSWFSLFQVASAYTNLGMSLVDQSMIPFQKAYPMITMMVIIILAGNTAFPILLRLFVWVVSKCIRKGTRLRETLQFLLDHPRRCFLYLFPSHQTWFLASILAMMIITDWFFFLVLDIGNPEIEKVPVNARVALGLLQAAAVRAAGFATVSLSALAPAVKVLYVIMMYVAVYPIAMSVRSTNVYEERSLGIYAQEPSTLEEEPEYDPHQGRTAILGKYLGWHMRRQLAFDMWWLALGLFLICIIERDGLSDPGQAVWLNIFSIVFEIVSAYGTVGLSLGLPTENYSLSGALRPLSKLILCAVMIRGRHRGLPVAIDRAIVIPNEFKRSHEPESVIGVARTRTLNGQHQGQAYGSGLTRMATNPRTSQDQSPRMLGLDLGPAATGPGRGRGRKDSSGHDRDRYAGGRDRDDSSRLDELGVGGTSTGLTLGRS